jgi:hypothetical protein
LVANTEKIKTTETLLTRMRGPYSERLSGKASIPTTPPVEQQGSTPTRPEIAATALVLAKERVAQDVIALVGAAVATCIAERKKQLQTASAKGESATVQGLEPVSTNVFPIMIQAHPDVGARCIDIPNNELKVGKHFQLYDCNGTAGQIFVFDSAAKLIKMGELCVTALGDRDSDPVGLAACNGQANQTWAWSPKGNYVAFVGVNGLCLDFRGGGSEENGTPVDVYRCEGQANQLWLMRPPQAQ